MSTIEDQRKRYEEKFKPGETFTELDLAYESTRNMRDPSLIKDFSQSNEDYVVDSADPNNLEEQFIPDSDQVGNQYGMIADTGLQLTIQLKLYLMYFFKLCRQQKLF